MSSNLRYKQRIIMTNLLTAFMRSLSVSPRYIVGQPVPLWADIDQRTQSSVALLKTHYSVSPLFINIKCSDSFWIITAVSETARQNILWGNSGRGRRIFRRYFLFSSDDKRSLRSISRTSGTFWATSLELDKRRHCLWLNIFVAL